MPVRNQNPLTKGRLYMIDCKLFPYLFLLVFCTIKGDYPSALEHTLNCILLHTHSQLQYSFNSLLSSEIFCTACLQFGLQDFCFHLFVSLKLVCPNFDSNIIPMCLLYSYYTLGYFPVHVLYWICYSLFTSAVCCEFPIPLLSSMCLS